MYIHTHIHIHRKKLLLLFNKYDCVLSRVCLFAAPWIVAHQAPLSIGFPRQEYWNGVPGLLQAIFPTQGSNLHWQILYH